MATKGVGWLETTGREEPIFYLLNCYPTFPGAVPHTPPIKARYSELKMIKRGSIKHNKRRANKR